MTEKNENVKMCGGEHTPPALAWHKPRVDNFFRDAGGMDTFLREFRVTGGGYAMSAPVRFADGRKRTVGFWGKGRKGMTHKNQVYLYSVPPEIFEAWDEMGVDYRTGAEQVVKFLEPGRAAKGNQGLFIQLDENNRTVWAKHFADAVRWVNKKSAGSAPVGD